MFPVDAMAMTESQAESSEDGIGGDTMNDREGVSDRCYAALATIVRDIQATVEGERRGLVEKRRRKVDDGCWGSLAVRRSENPTLVEFEWTKDVLRQIVAGWRSRWLMEGGSEGWRERTGWMGIEVGG
jgi:hypothetical protein